MQYAVRLPGPFGLMDLPDDHRILGKQAAVTEGIERRRDELAVVRRADEDHVETATAPPQCIDHAGTISLEYLSDREETECVEVPTDDRARLPGGVDEGARTRSPGERFQSDAPRTGVQVEEGRARDNVDEDVEQRAANEIAHRSDPTLLPLDELPPPVAPPDDSHGPCTLRFP